MWKVVNSFLPVKIYIFTSEVIEIERERKEIMKRQI